MVWKKGTAPVPLIVYHKTPLTSIPVKGVLIATCLIICYIIVNAGNSRRKGAVSTTQAADPFPAPKAPGKAFALEELPAPRMLYKRKGGEDHEFFGCCSFADADWRNDFRDVSDYMENRHKR